MILLIVSAFEIIFGTLKGKTCINVIKTIKKEAAKDALPKIIDFRLIFNCFDLDIKLIENISLVFKLNGLIFLIAIPIDSEINELFFKESRYFSASPEKSNISFGSNY